MATHTLSILKPSVNNLSARIFVRAAGLDFDELDVWGKKSTPEFLSKDPADLTPLLEEAGCRRGVALGELRDHAVPLQQARPRPASTRPIRASGRWWTARCSTSSGRSIRFVTRATYPALGFPQYAGEVGHIRCGRRDEGKGAAGRGRGARRGHSTSIARSSSTGRIVHRRRHSVDRRHPLRRDHRVPARDRLRPPRVGRGVHDRDGDHPGRRLLGAGRRCARLHRLHTVAAGIGRTQRRGPAREGPRFARGPSVTGVGAQAVAPAFVLTPSVVENRISPIPASSSAI